jgi:hypothetical protein
VNWQWAVRDLWRHRVRTALSLAGIAIASALLLDMMMLSGGLERSFEKLLLSRGADVNARDRKFAQTALMWAAGHPAAVRLLVEHGADVRRITTSWDVKYTIYAPTTVTLEATAFGLLAATDDKREGTRAFLEKRAPGFKGA